jgi:molybdopterin-guanine dinucleotide biosynthesis protein A
VVRIVAGVFEEVVLVAREGQALPGDVDARVVRDPAEGLGPLAALATGLSATRAERAFVAAGDMPLLRAPLILRLVGLAANHDACVPLIDGFAVPTCAVYRRDVATRARALVAERRLATHGLLDGIATRYVTPDELRDVDPDLDSFRDCDTPEHYAQALRRAGQAI